MKNQTFNPKDLEKYSSAVSLSDMEIFIFPELLFSLVLANIMSPVLWSWKSDPWFKNIERKNPYRRVQRLKQFIMDHYEFNLDLDTWGLTTQDAELKRFQDLVDRDMLAQSNALFGYEGDKYYFDLDIRRHFGLDKYGDEVIPYWKTETLEAMNAFQFRDNYREGAGECVSLSTLYAAALFVICKIPLEDIFLLATPLHSQNFTMINDGILTNNRRIVTRNMWFNGSELSDKAQRALRNEQITIVANNSGYLHVLYPEASLNEEQYRSFQNDLESFLHTRLDFEILSNFLRFHSRLMKCFQIRHLHHGKPRFIKAETVYAYEHTSPYRLGDDTRDKLLEAIDDYECYPDPYPERILLNDFHDFLESEHIDLTRAADREKIREKFTCVNAQTEQVIQDLLEFTYIKPRYPDQEGQHTFIPSPPIPITSEMDREDILDLLRSLRETNTTADLAWYAYRDLSETDWGPFLKAAFERNPVIAAHLSDLNDQDVADRIHALTDASVYDSTRAAQPDEVWNFQRGDGLEKALALGAVWLQRHPQSPWTLTCDGSTSRIQVGDLDHAFPGSKGLQAEYHSSGHQ